jgi:hypothetical protein
MHMQIVLALLYDAVLIGVCGWALIRGGRPERLGAMLNLVASAASSAARMLFLSSWAPGEALIISIDCAVIAGFYWLAVSTTRFWPIWAFGFALANIFISFAGALLPALPLFAYTSGLGIYAYLALGSLAMGTFCLPKDASPVLRNGSRRLWQQHQNQNQTKT